MFSFAFLVYYANFSSTKDSKSSPDVNVSVFCPGIVHLSSVLLQTPWTLFSFKAGKITFGWILVHLFNAAEQKVF